MHENPEWEKARQALASISKAGAAGSSAKASSSGPVASAQVRVAPAGPGTLSGRGTAAPSGVEDAPGARSGGAGEASPRRERGLGGWLRGWLSWRGADPAPHLSR